MSQKASRGRGFSITETENLLELIEEVLPIGMNEWDAVLARHVSRYPENDRTRDSIKRKFASLYNSKKPTGDPNCPPTVRKAKQLYNLIKERMDISDCESEGSFPGSIGQPEEAEEEDGAEDEDPDPLNNSQISHQTSTSDVASSINSSGKKRSAEGIQIRTPRARYSNSRGDDNSISEIMQFMVMRSEIDAKAEAARHRERMELEERRDARNEKFLQMMFMISMNSNKNSPSRGKFSDDRPDSNDETSNFKA